MKKHLFVLAAGAVLALSACTNGNNANNGTMTQAQQDSAVNARASEQEAKMKAGNDSMINATAKMRADSTMRADSMMKAQTATQQGAATAKTGATIVKQTKSVQHSSGNGASHTSGNTKSSTTTPANSTITKEQQNQQNNKFNER